MKKIRKPRKNIRLVLHDKINKRKILESLGVRSLVANKTALNIKRRNVKIEVIHKEVKESTINLNFLNKKEITTEKKDDKNQSFDKEAFDKKPDLLLGERI